MDTFDESTNRKKAWENFIYNNDISLCKKSIVSDSWKRCRQMNVNYKNGKGTLNTEKYLNKILKDNQNLVNIASPIMRDIYNLIKDTHFVLVLTNKDCDILEILGDKDILRDATALNFAKGSRWSEKKVGTNAIGTCIAIDKPIQIIGEEHYCQKHHLWTCSSSPIHDPDNNLLGCLNMSGSSVNAHSHTLGIVVSAAYSIEKHLELLKSHSLINKSFQSISEGIAILDTDYKIKKVNRIAKRIFSEQNEDIYNIDMKKALSDIISPLNENTSSESSISITDFNFNINGKRFFCSLYVAPIISNNIKSGYVVTFKEMKYVHKTVNTLTRNIAQYTFKDIITNDDSLKKIIQNAKRISKTGCAILIEGESGTGKELFAHAIHNESSFSGGPFVAVNCASFPRDLIESELFGYEKGAFTGALKEGNPGKFELADGGTLLLDEIGELPFDVQAKLLRILDDFKVRRIGGKFEKKLNLRVIAVTNKNLFDEVNRKNFREDLYFRLNVFKIIIPPLRFRKGDIEKCAQYFLNKHNREQPDDNKKYFSDAFLLSINKYDWIGNVRELQNIIERSYYLTDGISIKNSTLPDHIIKKNLYNTFYSQNKTGNIEPIDSIMKDRIIKTIYNCNGDIKNSILELKTSKATFYRNIKKYDIDIKGIQKVLNLRKSQQ